MRYAPTLVRLNSLLDWVVRWFRFRPCEGVCPCAPTVFLPENKNIPPKPSTQINKMRGALFPKQDGTPPSLNLHIQLDVVLTF